METFAAFKSLFSHSLTESTARYLYCARSINELSSIESQNEANASFVSALSTLRILLINTVNFMEIEFL